MMVSRRVCLAAVGAWALLGGGRASFAASGPAPASAPTTATAPAASAPTTAPVPLPVPDGAEVRAFDRPSDDGSAVIVEWPKPAALPKGVSYVVEIAQAPEDFAAGRFKSVPVPAAPKSSNPKYFGFLSEADKHLLYASITPADQFPPPKPGKLTAERVDELHEAGRLTEALADRAKRSLRNTSPEAELTAEEKADRAWLERFRTYLGTRDSVALKDEKEKVNAERYYYRLAVTDGTRKLYAARDGQPVVISAEARPDWFKGFRLNNLLFALVFSGIVMAFIQAARRNPNLFIRKIAGLEAVEEAIGRATEMGRSVYFVHGLNGVSSLSTIAALNILGRVARRCAEYDTPIRVMNVDAIVTAVSQEVVQQAYTEAGRPDAFDADDVCLVASDQFSFVAAVSGRMVREQPAAVFLMGYFYAESLLLAETGASTGAIQVAGTDAYTQLPFFVTTCDYTLIGEELYAASAYLSREPRMLGSLRGQDVGKAFLMIVLVVGTGLLTLGGVLARLGMDVNLFRNLFKAFS